LLNNTKLKNIKSYKIQDGNMAIKKEEAYVIIKKFKKNTEALEKKF
jgi:hypothetical protein